MDFSDEGIATDLCLYPMVDATSSANRTEARLLIVDDEPAQRKVLAVMMEQNRMACITASSAEEALNILQTECFSGDRP